MNLIILVLGKTISKFSKILNLGHGSTWPGHIALKLNPNFIKDSFKNSKAKVVLVTGTNGKTTTSKLIQTIFENNNKKVFVNLSGANLLNGVASSIILNSNFAKIDADFAIFEVDENVVPLFTDELEPDYIIALNLFRDQLDRYGELDSIISKWKKTYGRLQKTVFLLNGDDPQISYLGNNLKSKVYYFGLNDKSKENKDHEHAADSILCPRCGNRLTFKAYYFSHLGKWQCEKCGLGNPKLSISDFSFYPLIGTYSIYDTLAAVLLAKINKINDANIERALKMFKPSFGRQEQLIVDNKNVQLFLSKNPVSFNESLRAIKENSAKNLLIILNDRIPDGTDVSWIWDIDFELLLNRKITLYVAGDRVYDLLLRLKYANFAIREQNVFERLDEAISFGLKDLKQPETLYILPTYSAMLETRKILTGKEIL